MVNWVLLFIKKIAMKKLFVFSFLVLVLAVNALAQKNFIDQNFIEVTGKAEMEVVPNEIYLKIIIDEKDNNGKESLESLEKKMIKKLVTIGVNIDSQLVVSDFSSNFKFYLLKKDDIFTSKEYQLLVYDGKTVADVFMVLEQLGISNIEINRVDHSNIEELRREVKIKAIKAGKEKAKDLATAIGQNIGRALYINEVENYKARSYNSNVMYIRGESSIESESPSLEFEKIQLESSVIVYFELK